MKFKNSVVARIIGLSTPATRDEVAARVTELVARSVDQDVAERMALNEAMGRGETDAMLGLHLRGTPDRATEGS